MKLPYLPEEIISQILMRVPAKDVGRFNAVSKRWNSMISDPRFAKAHLACAQPCLMFEIHYKGIYCIDPFDKSNNNSSKAIAREVKLPFQRYTYTYILDSCCGLLLLSNTGPNARNMFIYNPITHKSKELPLPPNKYSYFHWGLVYDESIDNFKVFGFAYSDNVVLVLTVPGKKTMMRMGWKVLVPIMKPELCFQNSHPVFAATEKELYWLVREYVNHDFKTAVIHSIDIEKEELKSLIVPSYIPNHCCKLVQIRGSLCLMNGFRGDTIEVWVLEDRVNFIWSQKYNITVSFPSFINTMGGVYRQQRSRYSEFAMTYQSDGFSDLFKIIVCRENQVFLYDMKNQDWIQIAVFDGDVDTLGNYQLIDSYWFHYNGIFGWE